MEDLHYSVFDESSLLFDCYPGGNDTFIFCNRAVPRTDYKQVQALIRGRYPHFEQGGFLERARSHAAVARVQTVGGDFSPNTTRSAAALLADLFCKDQSLLPFARWQRIGVDRECVSVPLEVSGSRDVLQAIVWPGANEWQVELELMRASGVRIARQAPLILDGQEYRCDVVMRAGIAQVLICEDHTPVVESRLAVFRHIVAVRKQLGLFSHPAVGVCWWKRSGENLSIRPALYLSGNDTCSKETASGSAAVALALALHDGNSRGAVCVTQPSGEELRVRIQPGITGACPSRVFLLGPVKLRGELNSSYCELPQQSYAGLKLVQ